MFSGKKERVLEEKLTAAEAQNEKRYKLLRGITEKKEDTDEQFARLTASRAQMEKAIDALEAQMRGSMELSGSSEKAADDVHSAMMEINNAVGTFVVNHNVFIRQVKEQKEKITEIVENNKHFTTPMKHVAETPAALKEDSREMYERIERMQEFSKSMGVLSLNAAIEAGRMGEAGMKFITSAEEIRAFSENYEKEAAELKEQLKNADKRVEELEEQAAQLNQLLRENNISMGRLLQSSAQQMAAYETGQLELREMFSDVLIGRADALQQSQGENAKLQEQMLCGLSDIREEFSEQKSCKDELETIYKGMLKSAGEGL